MSSKPPHPDPARLTSPAQPSEADASGPRLPPSPAPEQLYRAWFETTGDAVLIHDDQGRFLAANPAAGRLLDYPTGEIERLTWADLELPDGSTACPERVARLNREGQLLFETVFRRRDGSALPVEVSARPFVSAQLRGIVSVCRDISQRRRAEEALRQGEARYRRLHESITDAYASVDLTGRIQESNQAFRALVGYSEEELGRLRYADITAERWHAMEEEILRDQVLREGTSEVYEKEYRRKDGSVVPVELRTFLLRGDTGEPAGMAAIVRDLTERKRADARREQRLLALTRPLDVAGEVSFEELFDLAEIQELQDRFARATGVASIITHPDGTPITRASNFCRLCETLIRATDKGRQNCYRSDAIIGRHNPTGPVVQTCLSGGLWDAGASVAVGGHHIANWLIGQVRNEAQDEAKMAEYARVIGVDETAFLTAFREVPSMSEKQFRDVADALFTLAGQLSRIAYQNLQQARAIAERQRTEATLRATEARQRAMIANMSDVIAILDRHGADRYTSSNLTRWFGWQPDEVTGSVAWTRVHPDDLPRLQAAFATLLRTAGATTTGECRYRCRDGSFKWIEFEASNLLHDSDIEGIFLHYRDISARKQAEDALLRERTLIQAILDSAPGIMYLYDDQGRLVRWNRKHEEWTGYSAEELSRMTLLDWYRDDPQSQQAVTEGVNHTIQEGHGEAEAELQKKDGSKIPMHFTASRLIIDGKMYFAGIGVDLTERKRMQKEGERLQEQLLQAQKVESVGRLAGGVAHDFNNMLGVILGNVEMALEEAAPDSPLHDSLQEIQKAARRSADLTRQLLAFARKQTVNPKVLDLNEALGGMLKMLQRLIGEDIQLVWLPCAGLWPVKIDPVQLDQVLANLIVNARDAIRGVGRITIETGNTTLDAGQIPHAVGNAAGDFVALAVSDTGVGMGKEIKAHLFEPFFTTKDVGEGTGLGLATVYGIVKQNEGYINVYSEPGQGTTFRILLPRADAPSAPGVALQPPLPVKGSGTLLLVEDEEQVLNMSRRILAEHGYTVLAARTPEDALELVGSFPGPIDLLVTDVVMPGMNGRVLYERVARLKPGLRCLYMSGYTANVIAHQGVLEEGVHFLEKPFAVAALTSKVREALAGARG